MIKEALQYIVKAFTAELKDVNGQVYSTQPLELVPQPRPSALSVHNLSGLIDYLKYDYDKQPPVLVHVASPTVVNVYSTFNQDFKRNHLLQAEALLPSIPFERFIDVEAFNVLLQSCFVENDHRRDLLAIVGNVREDNVTTVGDDGVSQQVTAKAGVASLENVIIPNPVYLKPYRTFTDVAQPESQFVFRMRTGPSAALFEADGGAWKISAIHAIRDHLDFELNDLIKDKRVTIIA